MRQSFFVHKGVEVGETALKGSETRRGKKKGLVAFSVRRLLPQNIAGNQKPQPHTTAPCKKAALLGRRRARKIIKESVNRCLGANMKLAGLAVLLAAAAISAQAAESGGFLPSHDCDVCEVGAQGRRGRER